MHGGKVGSTSAYFGIAVGVGYFCTNIVYFLLRYRTRLEYSSTSGTGVSTYVLSTGWVATVRTYPVLGTSYSGDGPRDP